MVPFKVFSVGCYILTSTNTQDILKTTWFIFFADLVVSGLENAPLRVDLTCRNSYKSSGSKSDKQSWWSS